MEYISTNTEQEKNLHQANVFALNHAERISQMCREAADEQLPYTLTK